MSEQIVERPQPAPAPQPPAEPAGQGSRTFLIVALAIVSGLIIGGAALLLLRGGGDPGETTGALAPRSSASPTAPGKARPTPSAPAPSASAGATRAASGTVTRTQVSSRDPFAPLVTKAPVEPTPSAAPGTDSATSTDGLRAAQGATISLLSIDATGTELTLRLDGEKMKVDEGETFARDYRLYDIFNDECAGFLYGDQNAVVCIGDKVTVG